MKTIKELYKQLEEQGDGDYEQGQYWALKDVLGLIDEMDNEDNWEFKCPVCGDDVLEELKKRITG